MDHLFIQTHDDRIVFDWLEPSRGQYHHKRYTRYFSGETFHNSRFLSLEEGATFMDKTPDHCRVNTAEWNRVWDRFMG